MSGRLGEAAASMAAVRDGSSSMTASSSAPSIPAETGLVPPSPVYAAASDPHRRGGGVLTSFGPEPDRTRSRPEQARAEIAPPPSPTSQYVSIYCHGRRVLARLVGDGWAVCKCGERIRVVW